MVERSFAEIREMISSKLGDVRQLPLFSTFAAWWRDTRISHSLPATFARFLSKLWEFTRESAPAKKKQRYGDADYDWEQRVNTTSATVNWRDRLLGQFLSPYQPTEPALFHEMLDALRIDFSDFTFVDIGSGKGRTLLLASDYPFKHIIGVEIIPELHQVAVANIDSYRSETQKCFRIESRCEDARNFVFPAGPLLIYLFNPLPEAGLAILLRNLEERQESGAVYVLYHNPEWRQLFAPGQWDQIGGTHQFSVFRHLS